ncbi:isoleucine--tRNA ligase [Trifolium repens]|nr:isoleucine--tRNA ligase [Trifolium repens]
MPDFVQAYSSESSGRNSQLVVIEAQIEVFGHMALKGYIYRGRKPVHYSPSSQTALAEAEFQTGYSSPTQDAIRKDLNLSLAELCVCFRVCVVAFVVSESGAAGFIIWRNGL